MNHDLKLLAMKSITLFFFFFLSSTPTRSQNTNLKQVLCNGATYSNGDPFRTSLSYVLDDLVSSTPAREGFDFFNISPYPNAFAYGHGTCNKTSNLGSSECGACLAAAKVDLGVSCPSRIGGRVVLVDCQMRYEQYPFSD